MKKSTVALALGLALPLSGVVAMYSASAAAAAPSLRCVPYRDCEPPPPPPPPNPCPDVAMTSATEIAGSGEWGQNHQHSTATLMHRRTQQADGSCAHTSAYVRVITHTWTTLALQGFHASVSVGDGQPWGHAYRYGVTGTWFGSADRTDPASFDVPLSVTYPSVTERLG